MALMYRQQPEGLDLFCGGGGCTKGYQQAGFRMTGVDTKPQPHYCGDEFYLMDALEFLRTQDLSQYAFIHASPPCQGYSRMRHLPWLKGKKYELLIEPVRHLLIEIGKPYVIENVSDAPILGVELCGAAFGLPLIRHRRFECSPFFLFPPCPGHPILFKGRANMSKYGRGAGVMGVVGNDQKAALGIDWMTGREMRQAVPPAYTRFIGGEFMRLVVATRYGV